MVQYALTKKSVSDNLTAVAAGDLVDHHTRNFLSILTKFQFQDISFSVKIILCFPL